jgi:hypothetical protein
MLILGGFKGSIGGRVGLGGFEGWLWTWMMMKSVTYLMTTFADIGMQLQNKQ